MITSADNKFVKHVLSLQRKSRTRRDEGRFVVEGLRAVLEVPGECLAALCFSETFASEKERVLAVCKHFGVSPEEAEDGVCVYVTDELLKKMAATETPQGILAVCRMPAFPLEAVIAKNPPLILILERLQDPGNLGTIIRAAEGAGVSGILLTADCADPYQPKVVRSTMGSIFRVPHSVISDAAAAAALLKRAGVTVYAAAIDGVCRYDDPELDYRRPSAFLIGNEGNGLSEAAIKSADLSIYIPMQGKLESLNAGIAAGVLMFEAAKHRYVL